MFWTSLLFKLGMAFLSGLIPIISRVKSWFLCRDKNNNFQFFHLILKLRSVFSINNVNVARLEASCLLSIFYICGCLLLYRYSISKSSSYFYEIPYKEFSKYT